MNWQILFLQNITLSIPFSAITGLMSLLLFGFKEKLNLKSMIKFTIPFALADASATTWLDQYGSIQTFTDVIVSTVLLLIIFNFDLLLSLVVSIITSLIYLVCVILYSLTTSLLLGKIVDSPDIAQANPLCNILMAYIFYLILFAVLKILHKKNINLINLRKFKIFNRKMNILKINVDNIKLFAIMLIPIFIFIFLNYSIYYYNSVWNINTSSYIFFVINVCAIIFSTFIMFLLIKKVIALKYIESELRTQQSYMQNINTLLKDFRAQKHGFLNHMNIIFGLLTLNEYDNAKEYLSEINQTIALTNNLISVNNPALSALLNVKAKYAGDNNVQFNVNVEDNLNGMNFKAFEIGEALGNIIDNAIEATLRDNLKSKQVNINIFSNDNSYIFDIANSGKTVPPDVLGKIFDEGFTTKSHEIGDHGFGLYICKSIIECNNGKIDVESKDNKTSFKISIPKVINNELRFS